MRFFIGSITPSIVVGLIGVVGSALTARPAVAQSTGTVTGTVTDQAGQPIASVRIAIVGTTLTSLTGGEIRGQIAP
jgi:hypothetical protein